MTYEPELEKDESDEAALEAGLTDRQSVAASVDAVWSQEGA